jgi:DNA uptake protein ComE-like DNA-binding protein
LPIFASVVFQRGGDVSAKKDRGMTRSAVVGVVALVFLIIGYQTALFVQSAAVAKIAANRDEPDTVYVYQQVEERYLADSRGDREGVPGVCKGNVRVERKPGHHTAGAENVRKKLPRKVESFMFDPNRVSLEELQRLGFSEKQARSIVNYRDKGGHFRRKSDFAKSFVVSDSIFRRLEPYISIPLTDLNEADSAAFDALPGIGGWFASKMVAYRNELGGYSCKEQLMEIYRFDKEKFDALNDLVTVRQPYKYPLWELPMDSLRRHPYIRNYETARAIVLFRENNPRQMWTAASLSAAGILSSDMAVRLEKCAKPAPEE